MIKYLLFIALFIFPGMGFGESSISKEGGHPELRIDLISGATLYLNGLKLIHDIGFFSIYKESTTGRQNIVRGPWYSPNIKRLIGQQGVSAAYIDRSKGIEYSYDLKQTSRGVVHVDFSMISNATETRGVEFGFCKLNSDLFKGGTIVLKGANATSRLPLDPSPIENRIIGSDKKGIRITSSFADLEILSDSGTEISIADFRNVPWDLKRSFYVSVTKRLLHPGERVTFSFDLTCLPPQMDFLEQYSGLKPRTDSYEIPNREDFFQFDPKKSVKTYEGTSISGKRIVVGGTLSELAVEILNEELGYRGIFGAASLLGNEQGTAESIKLTLTETESIPFEGFAIEVSNPGIAINYRGIRGCINGIQALSREIRNSEKGLIISLGSVMDYPDIPVRGLLTELNRPGIKDIRLFKRYINLLSRLGANTIILYHSPEHVEDLLLNRVAGENWTFEELKEINRYAQSLGIDVIPGMKSRFYRHRVESRVTDPGYSFYNPFNERSYDLVFKLYNVLINLYKPRYFFIAHDEISAVGKGKPEGMTDAQVFALAVSKIHDWLKKKNITTIMAGDMLLDAHKWSKQDAANSNNPYYSSSNTHEAINSLPQDIIILDWHYAIADSYPTINYFKKKGFKVWGLTWYEHENAAGMAREVSRYKADGVLASDWGFWPTLSPSATSLYAIKVGWDTKQAIRRDGQDSIFALANIGLGKMPEATNFKFEPVLLENFVNESTIDSVSGDEKGFFDLGGGFDLRFLPVGNTTLAGIPFNLVASSDSKNNCIMVKGNAYLKDDEQKVLLNRKAKSFAFLHTMFTPEPQFSPRPVGSYTVIYQDGTEKKIELIENYNITDFRSATGLRKNAWTFSRNNDILLGSQLGWRGGCVSGTPLNLQILILDNPMKSKIVREIRVRADGETKICLLAISVSN